MAKKRSRGFEIFQTKARVKIRIVVSENRFPILDLLTQQIGKLKAGPDWLSNSNNLNSQNLDNSIHNSIVTMVFQGFDFSNFNLSRFGRWNLNQNFDACEDL